MLLRDQNLSDAASPDESVEAASGPRLDTHSGQDCGVPEGTSALVVALRFLPVSLIMWALLLAPWWWPW